MQGLLRPFILSPWPNRQADVASPQAGLSTPAPEVEERKAPRADGKVLRNADPAPARLQADTVLAQAALTVDTPPELQKPKAEQALTLANFQTPEQRLIDQIAVPQDTNEEAAVAAHLSKMDIADAAHTVKANCRQITQMKGGDYLFFLKGVST